MASFNIEFLTFWENVLRKLCACEASMDWHEPAFADYVEKHLLKPGPGGLTAAWRSGHGVVPNGFSTYGSNTLERAWRTLKGLLGNRRGTDKIHHYHIVKKSCSHY